jgi:hypothetical protein
VPEQEQEFFSNLDQDQVRYNSVKEARNDFDIIENEESKLKLQKSDLRDDEYDLGSSHVQTQINQRQT